jgi:hypothetical protein
MNALPASAAVLRHALELALLLRLWPDRPALAGLAAARTAALFLRLERICGLSVAGTAATMLQDDAPPDQAAAAALWARLRAHQPGAPAELPEGTAAALADVWPLLGPAEWLLETGGDERLRVDPASGLNRYGCSHRPRPWAITFASSTASSISERGYAGAEAMRRRLLGDPDAVPTAFAALRAELGDYYGLPSGGGVVLAASGTDCELLALALAAAHPDRRPVTNIVLAAEETGSGVPLAAVGRHFAADTAGGRRVAKGELIDGFAAITRLVGIAARDAAGAALAEAEVAEACAAAAAEAREDGRHPLLHLLDLSKTGLLPVGPDALRAAAGDADVVVDACQARLSPARVGAYLAAGWMVQVTGSKFFTGPPFAGALLLPPAIMARLDAGALPAGLRDYGGRAEWPDCVAAAALPERANLGLLLRWAAALAEMHGFAAVPPPQRRAILDSFTRRVADAIAAQPSLTLLAVPPPERPAMADDWDRLTTVLSFTVTPPGAARPLDLAQAAQLYRWLNADLAPLLPGLPPALADVARRRCHIGQPVKLGAAAALRISAGARLVSGEPSHAALPHAARLEREIGDALVVLRKLALMLDHLELLHAADPQPSFV